METIIYLIFLLAFVGACIRLSFCSKRESLILASLITAGSALSWQWAVEQSERAIAQWLANTELMRSLAVLLSVEVAMQMWLALLLLHKSIGQPNKRSILWMHILRLFPGLLFPVACFAAVVQAIFAFPGTSFAGISTTVGILGGISLICGRWMAVRAVPEVELRIELLFLINAVIALLGIIATVNGQTTVNGNTPVDLIAMMGVFGCLLIGTIFGWGWYKFQSNRKQTKQQ